MYHLNITTIVRYLYYFLSESFRRCYILVFTLSETFRTRRDARSL
ncbi:hypothetical protein [Tiger frog virus]|uniref:Uncharacterized protein n=1 Tax=Rana tigrina ranavirus TaxID=160691 RepID=Q2WEU0_RTRV|nr:hypothetical protein [Tiger frog virus]QKG82197.1 hypothetical protein [Tiger frog virus]QKG82299.1 hypothetical protein [Tiger frog virus]QKG82402.1 hypothetical protein [Tiger frog virus]QKG82505.1 hypothetical protein [Tiger frog virus]